ncbi:MAG: hypothetical protein IPL61_18405 [Myxococcales bacterium]|nr:hypothetical protein [Myxococcales bacterium]
MPRVMVAVAVALLALGASGPARAQPPPTLVLVAPPATLIDAVTTGLDPWQVRVVVVPTPSGSAADLARSHGAGFVATIRGGTLELYDRDGATQARAIAAPIDDVEAASIALTIKTWMRLGPAPTIDPTTPTPPPDATPPGPPPGPPRPVPGPPRRWRALAVAGLGVRGNLGSFGLGARVVVGAGVTGAAIDALLVADLGGEVDTGASGAMWSQSLLSLRGGHRFALPRQAWLRPQLGVGGLRTRASAVQIASGRAVEKVGYGLGLDGVLEAGVARGRWSATVAVGVTWVPYDQALRGQLRLDVPAHLEPWLGLGVSAQIP